MGRASKDKRDIYYRKAKEEGFRARSAYKLLQIHDDFNVLDPTHISAAVDLCAAPGSWSQVLASVMRSRRSNSNNNDNNDNDDDKNANIDSDEQPPVIVAVDLQEMAPIEGVTILQGDITDEATARAIMALLNAHNNNSNDDDDKSHGAAVTSLRKADIVVCDGAPDVTGMHELDEYLQHQLLLAALNITSSVLRRGGTFVSKIFRGPATPFLVAKAALFFRHVRIVKPFSSRNASMESFLLCQSFCLPAHYVPRFRTTISAPLQATPPLSGERNNNNDEDDDDTTQATALRVSSYVPDAPHYTYSSSNRDSSSHNDKPPPPRSCEARRDASTTTTTASSPRRVVESTLLPFLSCGDLAGYDADMCYDRDDGAAVLPPVHPPLQAPYLPTRAHAGDESAAT